MTTHSDHEDGPPNAPARQSRPEAPPSEEKAHDARGGTTIQKVEIVITSDQSPSRIARAVQESLRELGEERRGGEKGSARAPLDPDHDRATNFDASIRTLNGIKRHSEVANRIFRLNARHEALLEYLQAAIASSDWHAVSDAANDLRCVEAELRCLGAEP